MTVLAAGQLIAHRYELTSRIAVGGMGEVWEASDTRLGRAVAVKILRPELSGDDEFRHRFRVEAQTVASLDHVGIAHVHDYGEEVDGPRRTAYLVMELVRGEPLSTVVARGALHPDDTLRIVEQAAWALHAAHERGYVHRDVKPGNILVGDDGRVKLTDFGIAKAANAAPVTRSGMVMGTAHYIAPEQATGGEAGPTGDVYSLGIVTYECLAGHRPFRGENAVDVAAMQVRDTPPPLPPAIPPNVRALVEAVLVKDPEQRYRSGKEFAEAVAAVRRGEPAPRPGTQVAAPETAAEDGPRRRRSRTANEPVVAPPRSPQAGSPVQPAAEAPGTSPPQGAAAYVARPSTDPGAHRAVEPDEPAVGGRGGHAAGGVGGGYSAAPVTGTGTHSAATPGGTGTYPAAAGGTGTHSAAAPATGTGAYPAAVPGGGTGAYPAAAGGTGTHPAAVPATGTGTHPAAPRGGTGAYPAAVPATGTGAYRTGQPVRVPATESGVHRATHPPAVGTGTHRAPEEQRLDHPSGQHARHATAEPLTGHRTPEAPAAGRQQRPPEASGTYPTVRSPGPRSRSRRGSPTAHTAPPDARRTRTGRGAPLEIRSRSSVGRVFLLILFVLLTLAAVVIGGLLLLRGLDGGGVFAFAADTPGNRTAIAAAPGSVTGQKGVLAGRTADGAPLVAVTEGQDAR